METAVQTKLELPGMGDTGAIESRSEPLRDGLTGTLVLPGKPMTWARARTKEGRYFTQKDRAVRMGDFAIEWQRQGQPHFGRGIWLAAGFEFVFARPTSHYGTGRNANLVKKSAP